MQRRKTPIVDPHAKPISDYLKALNDWRRDLDA